MLGGFVLSGLNTFFLLVLARGSEISFPLVLQVTISFCVSLFALGLTRSKQQGLGALTLLVTWFVLVAVLMLFGTLGAALGFAAFLAGISLGALIIGEWAVLSAAGFSVFFLIVNRLVNPNQPDQAGLLTVALPLLAIHTGLNYAASQALRSITRQMAANIEERTLRLSGASGAIIQQLLAARLDLNALMEETVKLVCKTFPDVNDSQLYLVDKDRKNATLVVSTNADGKAALGQQVGVGSLSVIGRVTIGGQSILVRDSGEGQAFRRAAFLEGTHAELVIPLRVGGETIGALDLQSQNVEAFSPEEIEALETLSNQIAVAIDNARLYADAQAKLAENRRLYEQTSASLREIERLNQQLTGGAWAEYLRGINTLPAYTIDPGTGRVEDAAEWTSGMAEVSRRNQVIVRGNAQSKTISLPISVRGQVIGAMEFEVAPDQLIEQEQMIILQQVVERLGLAAENIRLLDEAQRIAQREAMVNEITARMQAATNVEAVVAAATQSLADAFQAPRVSIRLGVPGNESNAQA
jgi:GAF domain-containing protein